MTKIYFIAIAANLFLSFTTQAQTDTIPVAFYTTKEYRIQEQRNLVNGIKKNLSLHLSADTEPNWEDAFYSM
ncbi:MAG TPA: hypothetical protein VHL77_09875, partial [Ferruginibacter sp.]|nr:hypothetical protein [Ferruginibacter sp.]